MEVSGAWHCWLGTQRPFEFLKCPCLQKHPMTQFLVQTGLGWGLAQVGAQAEPQGLNSSLSGHWGAVCGNAMGISWVRASHWCGSTHSPLAFFKYPSLQKQPMTHWRVHILGGSGLAQSGTQADPQLWKTALGPHFSSGKAGAAIPSAKALTLNSNAKAKRGYIAEQE